MEEVKINNKSKKKKKVGDGGGMKQVCMKQFPSTAYWKVLQPETYLVSEPANPRFEVARDPTITEVEAKYIPQKFTFISASMLPNLKQSRLNQTSNDDGSQRRILLLVNQYILQHQGRRVV